MQTSYLNPYIFSAMKNISDSISAWILLVFACAILAHFAFRDRKKVEAKLLIPGLNMREIFVIYLMLKQLHSGKMACGVAGLQYFQAMTHLFSKEGICYLRRTFKPMVMLYRAKTVKPLLSSTNLKKGFEYELLVKLHDGIFSSDKKIWRERRKLIAPTFNAQILQDFCLTFNEKAIVLTDEIMRLMECNNFIQIDALLFRYTLQITCETAMGIKDPNSKKNMSEYMQAVSEGEKLIVSRVFMPWLWSEVIFWRSKVGKQAKKFMQIIDKFVGKVILEKKNKKRAAAEEDSQEEKSKSKVQKNKKRPTFLDHLLDIHFQDNRLSMHDIAVEVETFIDAGSVTTAANLSWVLYLLGLYPDVQKKVHEELDQVLENDTSSPITKHHIKNLKYFQCVIKETMRLYPPTPYISRKLDHETIIDGYKVPKGTTCGIVIYALHRDPEIFPNPEVFDPDRFNDDEKIPTYAYIPFSAGPRNCIGQQFATLEVTILLASVLRRFKVKSMLPLDQLLLSADVTIAVRNGLYVAFESRKFSSK